MSLLKDKISAAIEAFTGNKTNGERWQRILFEAPAYAMERIAVYFYEIHYKSVLTKEDCVQINNLRDEIDATLEREDLEYLVKIMPEPEKSRYMAMLNGMQQKAPDSSNKQLESKPIVIHCPKCNEELELPGHAIGWKVKCSYCNEKFFATEEFVNNQQEQQKPKILNLNSHEVQRRIAMGGKEHSRISECLYGLKSRRAEKLHKKYEVGHIWVQENERPDFISGLPIGIGLIIDEVGTLDTPPAPSTDLIDDISHMIGRELCYVKTFKVAEGQYSHSYAVLADNGNEKQILEKKLVMPMKQQKTSAPQHLGKGTRVDWSRENKAFSEMLVKHGIRKFHVEMANPYCAEVSIPMTEDEDVVRDFANDLFHALDILDEGYDLEFGQLTDCSGIDINDDAKCYYVLFNQHDVAECNPGDGKYRYKIESITANGEVDEEDDDSDESADGDLTPAQIMKYIADGIKSGAIRSKSGEGYFVLKGEYYDAIEAGRKTTEYRDLTPRNLSLSIGIKTVKFQRGYGRPGQPPGQMRYEVSSVRLMDADDRECAPYNIPPGFFATTIAIHLGKRIG